MEAKTEDSEPCWGKYKPKGIKLAIRFIVKLHLSHGPVKKWLQRIWFSNSNRTPVDVEYSGAKFRLHPWDNVVERKMIFGSKCRDCQEVNYLAKHLGAQSTFMDIGANIGYYSCSLAAAGVGRIIAVEPHPVTLKRLRFNIASNDFHSISVAPVAVGDTEGTIRITTVTGDLGSSSILNNADVEHSEAYIVPVRPLEQLCEEMGVERIDALKIDVEGYEDRVLIPYFESTNPEYWPKFITIEHAHDENWDIDVLASLRKYGYKGELITRSNTVFKLAD